MGVAWRDRGLRLRTVREAPATQERDDEVTVGHSLALLPCAWTEARDCRSYITLASASAPVFSRIRYEPSSLRPIGTHISGYSFAPQESLDRGRGRCNARYSIRKSIRAWTTLDNDDFTRGTSFSVCSQERLRPWWRSRLPRQGVGASGCTFRNVTSCVDAPSRVRQP